MGNIFHLEDADGWVDELDLVGSHVEMHGGKDEWIDLSSIDST